MTYTNRHTCLVGKTLKLTGICSSAALYLASRSPESKDTPPSGAIHAALIKLAPPFIKGPEQLRSHLTFYSS
jgi:hypothetical protein